MLVHRTDSLEGEPLAAPVQLPNGSWLLEGFATRAGILKYFNPDGSERLEFRSPEEVEKSAAGLANCLLTHRHPPERFVTPKTAGERQRGLVLTSRWDAATGRVAVTCIVTDQRLLDVLAAGINQLSPGYLAETTPEPGEWQGQRYTHVQRAIRYNHLAVVESGRAGDECAFRLDEEGHELLEGLEPLPIPLIDTPVVLPSHVGNITPPPSSEGTKEKPMEEVEIVINGITFKVPKALADALAAERSKLKVELDTANTKATTTDAALTTVKADMVKKDEEVKAVTEKLDAANIRADSAQAEVEREKKLRNDAADPAKFTEAVNKRIELVTQARKVLGENYDFTKADANKIRLDALDKMLEGKDGLKAKLKGYSPDNVALLFDLELSRLDTGETKLGGSHSPVNVPVGTDAFEKAQNELKNRQAGKTA